MRGVRGVRGSLLLEAIFALFLLGVSALAALALLGHALSSFEVAESRGRAVAPAAGWLHHPPADSVQIEVGPGVLRWEGAGASGGAVFHHPRAGVWVIPAPQGAGRGGP